MTRAGGGAMTRIQQKTTHAPETTPRPGPSRQGPHAGDRATPPAQEGGR